MAEPTVISLTLPSKKTPHCTVEGCSEKVRGRGLCGRHYVDRWSKAEHVFYPKLPVQDLKRIKFFVAKPDLKVIDKLAKSAGLKRSEWLREVLRGVLDAAGSAVTE